MNIKQLPKRYVLNNMKNTENSDLFVISKLNIIRKRKREAPFSSTRRDVAKKELNSYITTQLPSVSPPLG